MMTGGKNKGRNEKVQLRQADRWEGYRRALSLFKCWHGDKVDPMMMVAGFFLFSVEYLYHDLLICLLLNFWECIHASLAGLGVRVDD